MCAEFGADSVVSLCVLRAPAVSLPEMYDTCGFQAPDREVATLV